MKTPQVDPLPGMTPLGLPKAPGLLQALEGMLDCSPCTNGCAPEDMTCASNQARAAIAAAKSAPKSDMQFACELLIEAYEAGEENGGSMDWADVDIAWEVAVKAIAGVKA